MCRDNSKSIKEVLEFTKLQDSIKKLVVYNHILAVNTLKHFENEKKKIMPAYSKIKIVKYLIF